MNARIRDFKTKSHDNLLKIHDLDISYKAIFNIFDIFNTILGFQDYQSFPTSSLRKLIVNGGKIFLFFCSIFHLFIVTSAMFFDHTNNALSRVSALIASISSIIQNLIWYQNRKYFRKTAKHLCKKYASSIHKSLKKLRISIFTGFAFNGIFFTMVFVFTYKAFQDNAYFIDSCFLGLVFNDTITRGFLTFIVTLTWAWIPFKDCFFVLYYSCLCKILRNIIKELIITINAEEEVSTLLNMHKNVVEDVSLVENHFSGLLGIVCWVCLYEIFSFEYLIISTKAFYPHRCMVIIWYTAMLLCFLLSASLVNDSLDDVKDCINQRSVFDSSNQNIRFVQKARFTNIKLTIWKILAMRRITIFSILGTFITYSYLIMS